MSFIQSLFRKAADPPDPGSIPAWRFSEPVWSKTNVNERTALHVSAYFAGVRVIVEDIAKLPLILYRQLPDGDRERAIDDPLWRLIHDNPNRSMSSQQFREYLTACAINRGNGYALKVGPTGQPPEQLVPIHPDLVEVSLNADWAPIYSITHQDGTVDHLGRDRVFHLPGLTITGVTGVSVIEYARQTLGNIQGANRQAGTFFGNGMRPSGILTHPRKLTKDTITAIRDQLLEKASGENTNALLLFDEDMKYTPVSINSRDSQFLESRAFEVLEVCRWLRVKPHKIAEMTHATFSNIEQESQDHVTDTLMPWGGRWNAAMTTQVVNRPGLFVELLYDALLRGSTLDRYQAYAIALGGNNSPGWQTVEEVRARENFSTRPRYGTLNPGPGATNQSAAATVATPAAE